MRITSPLVTLALCCCVLLVPVQSQTKESKTEPTPLAKNVQTTSEPPLLTRPEQDLLNEINTARANPTAYISYLEQYRSYYHDRALMFPDGSTLVTNEGVAALEDAIVFLRTLKPLAPFEVKKGMVLGAKLHLEDMLKTQKSGHIGSDRSKPEDRLTRFGTWQTSVGENIVYQVRSPRFDVIGLIVDDGVTNRGHRMNLFKPEFKVIGISAGGPFEQKTIAVITFAGGFVDKGEAAKPTLIQY